MKKLHVLAVIALTSVVAMNAAEQTTKEAMQPTSIARPGIVKGTAAKPSAPVFRANTTDMLNKK